MSTMEERVKIAIQIVATIRRKSRPRTVGMIHRMPRYPLTHGSLGLSEWIQNGDLKKINEPTLRNAIKIYINSVYGVEGKRGPS